MLHRIHPGNYVSTDRGNLLFRLYPDWKVTLTIKWAEEYRFLEGEEGIEIPLWEKPRVKYQWYLNQKPEKKIFRGHRKKQADILLNILKSISLLQIVTRHRLSLSFHFEQIHFFPLQRVRKTLIQRCHFFPSEAILEQESMTKRRNSDYSRRVTVISLMTG